MFKCDRCGKEFDLEEDGGICVETEKPYGFYTETFFCDECCEEMCLRFLAKGRKKMTMINDREHEQRKLSNLIEMLRSSLMYEDYKFASELAMDISNCCDRLNELGHEEEEEEDV